MFFKLAMLVSRPFLAGEVESLRARIGSIIATIDAEDSSYSFYLAQKLLVSGEDRRASSHAGVDVVAIFRALFVRISSGRRQGGSTLEQQVVRVLTGAYEITLRRKFREALLALHVSRLIPKHRFPQVYLMIGYFGTGLVGYKCVEQHLRRQGLVDHVELCAAIVARLKYPEPRVMSERRWQQLNLRSMHLVRLYHEHSKSGVYDFLELPPIRLGEPISSWTGTSSETYGVQGCVENVGQS
ncbi:penicillin-binding protein [Pandoraea eparura]|uniref:Penicillin-binding protein n=1 Tax=Pandoraea eparura TaxID=2508291 RepID=A0A5E4UI01_9BURK|nr:transglycosylase domain-containing protein [Pandoraea eparura]VVD98668.1 penicillin-binding protein [Pandoraea eparura]